MTKLLAVGQDAFTLVDDDVFEWAMAFRWHRSGTDARYVSRKVMVNGRMTTSYLHREIAATDSLPMVDHVNHDTFDNRRANLRAVTAAQNSQNRSGAQSTSKTGVRNVFYEKARGRYRVRLEFGRRVLSFGRYKSLEDAERAAIAARQMHYTHSAECGAAS